MSKGKTGTPIGRIVNTNNVSRIKCNCRNCFHSVWKNKTLYCEYYDLVKPHKTKCARFYSMNEFNGKVEIPQKKKPTLPWEMA